MYSFLALGAHGMDSVFSALELNFLDKRLLYVNSARLQHTLLGAIIELALGNGAPAIVFPHVLGVMLRNTMVTHIFVLLHHPGILEVFFSLAGFPWL
jgi:hypothetical protein